MTVQCLSIGWTTNMQSGSEFERTNVFLVSVPGKSYFTRRGRPPPCRRCCCPWLAGLDVLSNVHLKYIANLHWVHPLCKYGWGGWLAMYLSGFICNAKLYIKSRWQKTNKLHGMAKMATFYGENIAADFDDKLWNCVYPSQAHPDHPLFYVGRSCYMLWAL